MTTLFERIGGEPALNAAVELFYTRVLHDRELAPLFGGIDMPRLKEHQRRFLSLALGGPNAYAGRDLGTAHRRIAERHGLNDGHFDAVLGHLGDTLIALGVPAMERDETLSIAESVRGAVLGR
jgi:hemoglobin